MLKLSMPSFFLRCICLSLLLPYGIASAQFPSSWASENTWGDQPLLDTIIEPSIHSLALYPKGWPLSPPILEMNGEVPLHLTFDVIGGSPQFLYQIIHCDKGWNRSSVMTSAYIDAMQPIPFPSPAFSSTAQPSYAHYSLTIPNEQCQLKISGNYVIQILDPYNMNQVVAQKQFAISEQVLDPKVVVRAAPGAFMRSSQRVQVSLNTSDLGRNVSTVDLSLYVSQNWGTPCAQLLPGRQTSSLADLEFGDYDNGVFPGLNEWKVLNLQSLVLNGQGVETITSVGNETHVQVTPGQLSFTPQYTSQQDLNGLSVVGLNSEWPGGGDMQGFNNVAPLNSDYVWAYFTYGFNWQLEGSDVYLRIPGVTPAFEAMRMEFNSDRNQYECSLLLKQGVYSYRYEAHPVGAPPQCNDARHQGVSFSQTENDYYVMLYYRPFGSNYDRLVAYKRINYNAGN